ncbi:cyclin-J18-like isoform X7 [Alnus glutinosa]|nr:cyclin-J18-like isoform X6 [Alnus glutinosa]XP_062172287.1 cyclin-J18-like isoform X7 [Alnus glutinosa]
MNYQLPASSFHSTDMRLRLIQFLMRSTQELEVSPNVKYAALSFFADRFYPSLSRLAQGDDTANWLLQPIRESNLQLFALISLWISSKIHDSRPLSVKSLKSLGDKTIKEQHFTTRDFLEAELVLLQETMLSYSFKSFIFISREWPKLGRFWTLKHAWISWIFSMKRMRHQSVIVLLVLLLHQSWLLHMSLRSLNRDGNFLFFPG